MALKTGIHVRVGDVHRSAAIVGIDDRILDDSIQVFDEFVQLLSHARLQHGVGIGGVQAPVLEIDSVALRSLGAKELGISGYVEIQLA